jgi:hypothetical protein
MGSPAEVAKEFMDSIYEDKSEVIDRLIKQKTMTERMMHGYEYKSRTTILGLPLVHIRFRSRHDVVRIRPFPVAKGIIAIGDIAIGVWFRLAGLRWEVFLWVVYPWDFYCLWAAVPWVV